MQYHSVYLKNGDIYRNVVGINFHCDSENRVKLSMGYNRANIQIIVYPNAIKRIVKQKKYFVKNLSEAERIQMEVEEGV